MRIYPSSMTDAEWEILRPLLPEAPTSLRGRPRDHSRRDILNGIFYVLRTGGAWRMMPHDLPHWKTCYHYFRLWAKQGHWDRIHHAVRDLLRLNPGRVHMATRSRKGYWRMCQNERVRFALNNRWLEEQGVPDLRAIWTVLHYGPQARV